MNMIVWWKERLRLPFHPPDTVMIVGPTMTGKTSLVYKILKHASGMFQTPSEQIVIAFTEYQPLFEEMRKTLMNWICIKGYPLRNRLKIGVNGFSVRRYDDESCKEREIF